MNLTSFVLNTSRNVSDQLISEGSCCVHSAPDGGAFVAFSYSGGWVTVNISGAKTAIAARKYGRTDVFAIVADRDGSRAGARRPARSGRRPDLPEPPDHDGDPVPAGRLDL